MFIVIVIIVKANSLRSGPLLILHIHPTIATLLLLLLLLLLANVCAIATHVTATRTHQLLRIIIRESQANAYQATQQHILLRKICPNMLLCTVTGCLVQTNGNYITRTAHSFSSRMRSVDPFCASLHRHCWGSQQLPREVGPLLR